MTPAVAEALVEAVGGNPLALIEAPAQLSPAERSGRQALPAALPVGARLEIAYARRLDALPSATREGLLVAALSADGATAPLRAALGGLDVLAPAEDAGMIAVDTRGLSFAHPIVRTAIVHAATPGARRAAHRALAAAASGPQRAWHLAAAAQAPDEALAAELETLGYDAAQRGAPATAATALARAAELSPERPRAIGRMVAASAMAITAGGPARAKALLDPVLADAREPGLRADVQLLRGMAIQQSGSPMAAFALLEAEAELVAPHDPARAAGLLTQAGVALVAHGPMDRLAALAERALDLAPRARRARARRAARVGTGDPGRARPRANAAAAPPCGAATPRPDRARSRDPRGRGARAPVDGGLRRRRAAARMAHRHLPRAGSHRRARVPAHRLGEPAHAPRLAQRGRAAVRRGGRARRGRRRQLPAFGDADHGGVRKPRTSGRTKPASGTPSRRGRSRCAWT